MACPYCNGEHFKNDAELTTPATLRSNGRGFNNDAVWKNECLGCGKFSLFDESSEKQIPLETKNT